MASSTKARSKLEELNISDSDKPSSSPSFYPLRMITDHRTEMYVKFAKIMLIFQGPITEKRRNAISELTSKFKYASRLISDDTYKKETLCKFNVFNFDDFYRYFRSRVKQTCEEGYNLIIIDQSITNMFQMKYFFFLAQKMQYLLLPYPPLVDRDVPMFRPLREDSNETGYEAKNQAMKVELSVKTRVDQLNHFRHLFCGWFLHDVDSAELREEANLYLQDCFDNLLDFKEMFTKISDFKNFKSYYNMYDKRQDLAYCVVKMFHNLLDIQGYMSKSEFMSQYGKMSKLYIVGFVVSPHMVAARVKLTFEQRKLWEMFDDLDEKREVKIYPTELLKSTKVVLPDEEVTLIASKSNRTIITGDVIHDPTGAIPPRSKGRSCHILLGRSNEAPVKNVNYDVPLAVFREINVVQKYSDEVRPYDLDRCLIRRIGKYWFIYLKETLIVNGFFASCCGLEGLE